MSLARFHPYLKGKHNFTSCQGDTVRHLPDKPNNTGAAQYSMESLPQPLFRHVAGSPTGDNRYYDHSTQPSTHGSTGYTSCSARTSSTSSRTTPPAPRATGQQDHWHPNPEHCVGWPPTA